MNATAMGLFKPAFVAGPPSPPKVVEPFPATVKIVGVCPQANVDIPNTNAIHSIALIVYFINKFVVKISDFMQALENILLSVCVFATLRQHHMVLFPGPINGTIPRHGRGLFIFKPYGLVGGVSCG